VSLESLTSREAVLAALHEFDELGREAFLAKYGFGPARSYFLTHDENLYDSKAVVGAAVGFEHPERGPLRSSDFSGGEQTVQRKLEELGFEVVSGALDEGQGTWWVNQGATFDKEHAGGYVWAPQTSEGGRALTHHVNVSRLRRGDLIVHYARGMVRAIGLVSEAAREEPRPAELPTDMWAREGYLAPVEYLDAPTPIALEEIPTAWRLGGAGPFTRHGGVKQGYLFPLDRDFLRRFAAEFGPRWPALSELTAGLAAGAGVSEFLRWGARCFAAPEFDREERDDKLQVGEELRGARAALMDGEGWQDQLAQTFRPPNNLLPWQVVDRLKEWLGAEESTAAEAFTALWGDGEFRSRGRRFLELLPREVVSGRGMRTAVLSYFAGANGVEEFPIYRPTPFEMAYELTSTEPPSAEGDEVDVYERALGFLDQLFDEAKRAGLQLRDRLDAQGVLWAVTRWPVDTGPIASWPQVDREALLRDRGELPDPPLGLDALSSSLLLDVEYLHEVERLIRDKGQLIFYGPPGTGKTYVAHQLALHFAGSDERVKLVQFHPSYAYEDFVEGYRPKEINGQPGFGLMAGPLKEIADAAADAPDELFVLIIDEINRGNVAKVFGELYFLLEYREERIRLQYSAGEFTLPRNLWLVGTMNTADRSIALMDAALRRRFYFVPFFPDEPPVAGLLRRWLRKNKPDLEWVADVVDRANAELGDRNVAIGPSYFMRANLSEEWVDLIWKHAVLPYVAEQFFGETDRLDEFEFNRLRYGPREAAPLELPPSEQPDETT
jgi:MoxR-like ATPase